MFPKRIADNSDFKVVLNVKVRMEIQRTFHLWVFMTYYDKASPSTFLSVLEALNQ